MSGPTVEVALLLFVAVCLVGVWILAEVINAKNQQKTEKTPPEKKGGVQSNRLPADEDDHLE